VSHASTCACVCVRARTSRWGRLRCLWRWCLGCAQAVAETGAGHGHLNRGGPTTNARQSANTHMDGAQNSTHLRCLHAFAHKRLRSRRACRSVSISSGVMPASCLARARPLRPPTQQPTQARGCVGSVYTRVPYRELLRVQCAHESIARGRQGAGRVRFTVQACSQGP